jgi:hypothetical protein
MLPALDIKDSLQRFTLLTPEQQVWYDEQVWDIPPRCTEYNLQMAYSIAKIFPIRLKWYRMDRFNKLFMPCKKFQAEFFVIQSRVKEINFPNPTTNPGTIDLDLYSRLWDYKIKKAQTMPVDPYLQTR